MPITKYSAKGAALSFAEMDANWTELEGLLTRLGTFTASQTPAANQIPVLDVNGTLKLQQTSTTIPAQRFRYNETSYYLDVGMDGNGDAVMTVPEINGVTSGKFKILIGSTGSIVVDPAGNFLVGAQSGSYHVLRKLNNDNYVAEIDNPSASTPWGLRLNFSGVAAPSGGHFLVCLDQGASRLTIAGNGNVSNANNSYGAISDAKLKTDIETARNYLNDLCAVQVRKYNFVDDPDAPRQLGVVAQELEVIFPNMVEGTPDRAERQKKDESGKLLYEQKWSGILDAAGNPVVVDDLAKPIMEMCLTGETTKSVKYSVFVPMLITAVQELKVKYDALEARLTAAGL